MSEPTPRLNLIQRVMQKTALGGARIIGLEPPQTDSGEMHPQPVANNAVAKIAPAKSSTSHEVQLDYAKLRDARVVTPSDRKSWTYNEFRAVKRKLLPMARAKDSAGNAQNIVMVTSALPGEGKTFTSINLAIGLAAESNLEVILVDGDATRCSAGQHFLGNRDKGLIDLLTDTAGLSIDDVLHRCSDLPNLHVMFSGKRDDTAPELFASKRMADICDALAKRFAQSIVIIDTPPVLAAAEPVALVPHIDHVLMVVAGGTSGRHQIEEALTTLASCRSISLLFNKAPKWQRTHFGSYYYYGYGIGENSPAEDPADQDTPLRQAK